MIERIEYMKLIGLQKMTVLDFPGRVACIVFTFGCNFRCPFCHNASLVLGEGESDITEEEFFSYLQKRKGILDGVCVTGGEPLLQKDILPAHKPECCQNLPVQSPPVAKDEPASPRLKPMLCKYYYCQTI